MNAEVSFNNVVKMELRKAILLYEGNPGCHRMSVTYGVVKDAKGLRLDNNPRVMELEDYEDLLRALHPEQSRKKVQYIPDNLLSICPNGTSLTWWTPSARRDLYFRIGKDNFFSVNAWCPALVMRAEKGKGFRLFALDRSERPTLDTVLYHAPFPQIGEHGGAHLCGVRRKPQYDCASIDKWISVFFDSAFTSMIGVKVRTEKREYQPFLDRMQRLKREPKWDQLLIPTKYTLETFL